MLNQVNFNVIKEIQDKADIVAVISSFIKLTRKGNNYIGLCPFHPDKNPSLVVSPKKKIFKCFVCNAKGNVFSFVQQYQKIPFMEAVKVVANLIGYDESKLNFKTDNTYLDPNVRKLINLNNQVNDWFKGFLHNPENRSKLDYLNKRGLNTNVVEEFEFGYAPKDRDLIYRMASNTDEIFGTNRSKDLIWNEKELLEAGLITINTEGKIFDFFNDRITIPIYDNNGYLVAFSGRTISNSEPKYLNTAATKLFSKANVLFNFHKVRKLNTNKIIIVEGFMDAIAFVRSGYPYVVATMGVALSNEHLNALRILSNLDTVILSFDNDDAGTIATVTNGQKLMENGFNTFVVGPYDKKIKDVDELLKSKSKVGIDEILENRTDFITFLIEHEFDHKKPLDEIQKSVNKIIKHMLDFGDNSLLLRQQHLKLLANKSGLAFEDLKDKYEYDFKQIGLNTKAIEKNIQRKPYKPNNDVGLNPKFIEPEKTELSEQDKKKLSNGLTYSQSDYEINKNKLNKGFDKLILVLVNYSKGFKEVDELLNIRLMNCPLDAHKFIFKSMEYLYNKYGFFDEKTLLDFLKEKGSKDDETSRNYRQSFEYFQNLVNEPTYMYYHKNVYKENCDKRINDTILEIQGDKYEFVIADLSVKIWKLGKEDKVGNQIKIDKLQREKNETLRVRQQWEKQNNINKKRKK